VLDLTRPTLRDLDLATAFIGQHAARGAVYVHCKAGFSRSAAVAGAYLIRQGLAASAAEAAEMLRSRRPGIILRPEVLEVLEEEAARSSHKSTASGILIQKQ
jgi:protein-tyrosine phosphatase